jgi:ABC-type glycerol-3-phosphate transport system permease component
MTKHRSYRYTLYLVLSLFTLIILIPPFWLLLTSIKSQTEYIAYPIQFLPSVARWENYLQAVTRFPYWRYFQNSAFLAIGYSVLCVFSSAMAGYAFSRYGDVRGRSQLFALVIVMLIVPETITIIPQFIVFARMQIVGTYWPWVLWGVMGSAFHIFLFRQFFLNFPAELEDAAEVDGANFFQIFLSIFLPNAKPVLATSFIFNFTWVWGDYFTPLLYLNEANTTLAVKLSSAYINPKGFIEIPLTMAGAVIYCVPLLLIFFLGQKYIMEGVITSGLKG